MGTRINSLPVTRAVDGDTVKVLLDGVEESLRLACVDTEESYAGGSKPVTAAGLRASEMAKAFFEGAVVDIEFDTDDPQGVCLAKHRGNYGRLICYVHKRDVNYNLMLVRDGWSPYFPKYGRSRQYHDAFVAAEAEAQAHGRVIWNPLTNAGGQTRDYDALLPWWHMRGALVEDYRRFGLDSGVLSVRLDYDALIAAARAGHRVTVLCDLQGGISKRAGDGALIYAGSPQHPLGLWIDNVLSEAMQPVVRLIDTRYAGHGGRGYVYVGGEASLYRDRPQIVLRDAAQLSDQPPA